MENQKDTENSRREFNDFLEDQVNESLRAEVPERLLISDQPTEDPEQGYKRILTEELNVVSDLRRMARLIKKIIETDIQLFNVRQGRIRSFFHADENGHALMKLVSTKLQTFEDWFPDHVFNPYVQLVRTVVKPSEGLMHLLPMHKCLTDFETYLVVDEMNDIVKAMRAYGRSQEFRRTIASRLRQVAANRKSLVDYIDAIFEKRGSRHLVLRLDLAYSMESSVIEGKPTSINAAQARADLDKFLRHVRKNYPLTGHAEKIEYGLARGFHIHVLLLLNGHLVQQGVTIVKAMGEHWRVDITEGQGRYFNCNAVQYAHSGIGMINHYDHDKRAALRDKVAAYLTKGDFWVRFEGVKRTFSRGEMPKEPVIHRRPRRLDVTGELTS